MTRKVLGFTWKTGCSITFAASAGCCGCCGACFLITLNLFVVLIGLILLVFGIMAMAAPGTLHSLVEKIGWKPLTALLPLETLSMEVGIGATVTGALLFIIAVTALVAACRKIRVLLTMYKALIFLLLLLECGLFFYITSHINENGLQGKHGMWTHALRLTFKCCDGPTSPSGQTSAAPNTTPLTPDTNRTTSPSGQTSAAPNTTPLTPDTNRTTSPDQSDFSTPGPPPPTTTDTNTDTDTDTDTTSPAMKMKRLVNSELLTSDSLPWSCCGFDDYPDQCSSEKKFQKICQETIPNWIQSYQWAVYLFLVVLHLIIMMFTCCALPRKRRKVSKKNSMNVAGMGT